MMKVIKKKPVYVNERVFTMLGWQPAKWCAIKNYLGRKPLTVKNVQRAMVQLGIEK